MQKVLCRDRTSFRGHEMLISALEPSSVTRTAVRLDGQSSPLLLLAVVALVGGLYLPDERLGLLSLACGMALLWVVAVIRLLALRYRASLGRLFRTVAGFVEWDHAASFTTFADGTIGYLNRAARKRFGSVEGKAMVAALGDSFAARAGGAAPPARAGRRQGQRQ